MMDFFFMVGSTRSKFVHQQAFEAMPCAGLGHAIDQGATGGDVAVGITGTTGLAATVGDTLTIGTTAAELTPRLLISMDPNGMPVRAIPPGVVGDVEVGMVDEITPLEPAPHIPDRPEVCAIPDVADIPYEAAIPDVSAVAGAALPTTIPPPS
jgi:hypothetical protein